MRTQLLGTVAFGILGLCVSSTALAGANEGGFLLLHTDDSLIYTSDDEGSYCNLLLPECPNDPECVDDDADCLNFLINDLDPTSDRGPLASVIWAIGAFPEDACPGVAAVQFGLDWTAGDLTILAWGPCGPFEIPSDGWPTSRGSGTAVSWGLLDPVKRQAFPVYWFAAYSYYGPIEISIVDPPFGDEGVVFADDSAPSIIDPVPEANRGSLGLNGATGSNPYFTGGAPGACCLADGSCVLLTEDDCSGEYLGDGVPCDPNPCDVVPSTRQSWGEVKSRFRD